MNERKTAYAYKVYLYIYRKCEDVSYSSCKKREDSVKGEEKRKKKRQRLSVPSVEKLNTYFCYFIDERCVTFCKVGSRKKHIYGPWEPEFLKLKHYRIYQLRREKAKQPDRI